MDDREDDLERTVGELAATLDELRDELEPERRTSRVRELVRFTEQFTIPAIIAILETNVRLLEMLQGAIRLADGRLDEGSERTADRAFDAIDGALSDARDALAGAPGNSDARLLLEQARELRAEAERQVRERRREAPPESARQGDDGPGDERPGVEGSDVEGRNEGDAGSGTRRGVGRKSESRERPHEVPVDVEAELETIRREVGDGDKRGNDGPDGDDSPATDVSSDTDYGPTADDRSTAADGSDADDGTDQDPTGDGAETGSDG
jgi:hypothetical protein